MTPPDKSRRAGELVYQEHSLDSVLNFFAKAFKPKKGQEIRSVAWFVDVAQNKVVFRLFIDSK